MREVQIAPRLGERAVTKVKTSDVEALASAMLSSGLKQKSVHNVLVFLNGVFEHAIERGWTNENPVRRAAKPKPTARTGRESRSAVPDHGRARRSGPRDPGRGCAPGAGTDRRGRRGPAPPPPPDVLGPGAARRDLAAALTGLRQSELLGLRWRDIDWEAQRIRVRNTFVRGEHSARQVRPLDAALGPDGRSPARELDAWSQRTAYDGDDDLVFAHPHSGRRSTARRSPSASRTRAATRACEPCASTTCATRSRRGWRPPGSRCGRSRSSSGTPTQDDPDLRPLRAVRAGGRDGQPRVRAESPGSNLGPQLSETEPIREAGTVPVIRHWPELRANGGPLGWGPKGRWFKSSRPDIPRNSQTALARVRLQAGRRTV